MIAAKQTAEDGALARDVEALHQLRHDLVHAAVEAVREVRHGVAFERPPRCTKFAVTYGARRWLTESTPPSRRARP